MELIKAREGCYVTQATLKEGEERVFGKEVSAIVPSKWTEWTAEQKLEWEAEQRNTETDWEEVDKPEAEQDEVNEYEDF